MAVDNSLSLRQCAFTHAVALLILKIEEKGYLVKMQELNRTIEQQRADVNAGVSKTMDSRHLDRLAVDLVLFKNGIAILEGEDYRQFGEYWESLSGRWGGRFGLEDQPLEVRNSKLGWDVCHFEFRKI